MSFGRNTDNTDYNTRSQQGDLNTQQAGYDQTLGGRSAENHGITNQGINPNPMSATGTGTGTTGTGHHHHDSSHHDSSRSSDPTRSVLGEQTGTGGHHSWGSGGDKFSNVMDATHAGQDQSLGGRVVQDHGVSNQGINPNPMSAMSGTADKRDYDSSSHHHGGHHHGQQSSTMNPDPMGTRTTQSQGYSSDLPRSGGQSLGSNEAQYGSRADDFSSSNKDYSSTQRGMGSGMEEAQYGTSGRRMENTGMGTATGHGGVSSNQEGQYGVKQHGATDASQHSHRGGETAAGLGTAGLGAAIAGTTGHHHKKDTEYERDTDTFGSGNTGGLGRTEHGTTGSGISSGHTGDQYGTSAGISSGRTGGEYGTSTTTSGHTGDQYGKSGIGAGSTGLTGEYGSGTGSHTTSGLGSTGSGHTTGGLGSTGTGTHTGKTGDTYGSSTTGKTGTGIGSTGHTGTGTGMGTTTDRTGETYGTGSHTGGGIGSTGTGTGTHTRKTGDTYGSSMTGKAGDTYGSSHTGTGTGTHTGTGTGKTGTHDTSAATTKPSVTDKIAGKLEKVAGKVTGDKTMVEKGEEKVTGVPARHVN